MLLKKKYLIIIKDCLRSKNMKKFIGAIMVLVLAFISVGCTNENANVNNEIYNKSYNVTIDIDEFEDLVAAAIEKVGSSVLGVTSYITTSTISNKQTPNSTGSGVVYKCWAYDKDGVKIDDWNSTLDSTNIDYYEYLLITNRHVVSDTEETITSLEVYDGETGNYYEATLRGTDDKVDAAVLTFRADKFFAPVEFTDSDNLKRGNFAIAIGNPEGYDFYGSATFGIISYPKRYMSDDTDGDSINDWDAEYIQHDVAINPGNSGGALINLEGKLIGINTLKLVGSKVDNMGFAIPTNTISKLLPYLEAGEVPERFKLGINIYTVKDIIDSKYNENFTDAEGNPIESFPEDITNGIYVIEPNEDIISEGLFLPGDIIVLFNGQEIKYSYEFRAVLGEMVKGDTATFKVYRDGEYVNLSYTFE